MDFLKKLGIKNENYGACYGPDGWLSTNNQGKIDSINPSDNKKIASVYNCSIDDYTKVVNQSLEAQKEWRKVPAPERGSLVRMMGNALRDYKDPLGW
jgi:aldehyde dehydrogenase (NAD+)